MTEKLALEDRAGLPDVLRVLFQAYPREIWQGHEHHSGLVAFWLDRHLMFRKLLASLIQKAEAATDGKLDPQTHAAHVSRLGSMLLQNLHDHHQIEDHHYFPLLSAREPVLERGFALLDADHHTMDTLLNRFANSANGLIQGQVEPGAFHRELIGLQTLLNRHLVDEEELIVPIILKHGPDRLG